jgi:hypothetical protein
MWWWITQDWIPAAIVLGTIGAILLFTWSATHRGLYLVLAGGCLALIGGAYLVDRAHVTDAEQVAERTLALTDAFRREDAAALDGLMGERAAELRAVVTAALLLVDVRDDLRVTDVAVEQLEGDTATIHFRANATIFVVGHGQMGYQPSRWRLTWEREKGEWRVVAAQRLNPVDGSAMQTLEKRPS